MKHFQHTQRHATRIGTMYRRLRGPNPKPGHPAATIYEEMETGAVTGFFACTALALYFASDHYFSAALVVFSSFLGIAVGAVIGAVLWIGSADLPEDAVKAPAPGQGRTDKIRRH